MAAPSLTFPRPTFAKLSPHTFLLANLQPPSSSVPAARTNGRRPEQPRPPQINTGSLSHAHGSAVVRTGDTTVICGVRGEILPVTSIPNYRPPQSRADLLEASEKGEGSSNSGGGRGELRDYDLLVPNIELATGCSPQFLPGVPPTALAQTLSTRVYSLLHSCNLIDPEELRIWYQPPKINEEFDGVDRMDEDGTLDAEVKAYWVLYIDVLFVSFDGNPFDVAWAAILAALRDTRLLKARWDADRDMAVCSRPSGDSNRLHLRGLPIACTAAVLLEKREHGARTAAAAGRHWLLVDPDRLEESLCDETLTVVVDRAQGGEIRIRGITKNSGTLVGPKILRDFVGLAEAKWEEFRKVML